MEGGRGKETIARNVGEGGMHLFGTLVDNNGENFVIYRFIFLDLPIQSGYTRDGRNLFHGR